MVCRRLSCRSSSCEHENPGYETAWGCCLTPPDQSSAAVSRQPLQHSPSARLLYCSFGGDSHGTIPAFERS
eukprot:scaffold268565_cov20-Tisochrysis_lutea.AAC.1